MELRLSFPCSVCGITVEMNTDDPRGFDIVGKENIVQWSDFIHEDELPQPDVEVWERSDEMPQVGSTRFVKASYPFNEQVEERFWALFMPALSELNGWDSYPEEIEKSGMVECTFLRVISQTEREAWIAVRVEKFVSLSEAKHEFRSQHRADILKSFDPFAPLYTAVSGDWILLEGNVQSNLGVWAVIEKTESGGRMILYGEWEMHNDLVFCGHLELSKQELLSVPELAELIE